MKTNKSLSLELKWWEDILNECYTISKVNDYLENKRLIKK